MKKTFISGDHGSEAFHLAVREFEDNPQIQAVLILTAAGTTIDSSQYGHILQQTSLEVIGGVFPEIIYEGHRYGEGTVIVGFTQPMRTIPIASFEDEDTVNTWIDDGIDGIDPEGKTLFVFVDSLILHKSYLFDSLYNALGTIPNYVGGGAGSLEFNSFPCIFTNLGILEKGAVIGIVDLETSIGVSHGWEAIGEPLKVTEAQDNQIKTLDWKPAMDVYQKIVERHSDKPFDFNDFFGTTKSYPFGIAKLDAEMVVRDPYMQENGIVYTLDNIEPGSHINIMYGNFDSLIQGALTARDLAFNANGHGVPSELFLIDCISRVLFMNDYYEQELVQLDPDYKGFGALTLGEIANNGDAYLEIYNKTAVVCAIYE